MNKHALAFSTTLFLCASTLHAQATRTWVSGTGDDANPCSRTAPCRTFAGAISKTQAGGEIDALDPSTFGSVTITKSITIDGGSGQNAGITASGATGINVIAGTTDSVTIRNLELTGATNSSTGVNATQAAALHFENVVVSQFTTGINIAASSNMQVTLDRVVARDNSAAALSAAGSGNASQVTVLVRDSSFISTKSGPGVNLGASTTSTFLNTSASGNAAAGFVVSGSGAQISLANTVAASNAGPGLQIGSSSGNAVARLTACNFVFNSGAITITAGGFVGTYGDNSLIGLVTGGTLVSLGKQ